MTMQEIQNAFRAVQGNNQSRELDEATTYFMMLRRERFGTSIVEQVMYDIDMALHFDEMPYESELDCDEGY